MASLGAPAETQPRRGCLHGGRVGSHDALSLSLTRSLSLSRQVLSMRLAGVENFLVVALEVEFSWGPNHLQLEPLYT